MQGTDANLTITNVANVHGSCHDSYILRQRERFMKISPWQRAPPGMDHLSISQSNLMITSYFQLAIKFDSQWPQDPTVSSALPIIHYGFLRWFEREPAAPFLCQKNLEVEFRY